MTFPGKADMKSSRRACAVFGASVMAEVADMASAGAPGSVSFSCLVMNAHAPFIHFSF